MYCYSWPGVIDAAQAPSPTGELPPPQPNTPKRFPSKARPPEILCRPSITLIAPSGARFRSGESNLKVLFFSRARSTSSARAHPHPIQPDRPTQLVLQLLQSMEPPHATRLSRFGSAKRDCGTGTGSGAEAPPGWLNEKRGIDGSSLLTGLGSENERGGGDGGNADHFVLKEV